MLTSTGRTPAAGRRAGVAACALAVCSVTFAQSPATRPASDNPPTDNAVVPAAPGKSLAATTRPADATSPSATQPTTLQSVQGTDGTPADQLGKVVVTSSLDRQRDQIAPSLGAQTYTIGPDQIANTPGGDNAPFQQILLRAPGVAPDSFGQEHVRGEHGNLTYRVNGVLLPEPLNGFGQELDTRLIQSVTLIDGTLPAQFGFRTAGVVDVTTKSGETLQGGEVSIYGGSYGTIEPSFEAGGTDGKLDYFLTSSFRRDEFGIEGTTNAMRQIHDVTQQERLFGYFSYHLDDTSRLSLLLNASNADFQLPNTRGLPQAFALAGTPTADSADVNETQNEQEYYAVAAYQKTFENIDYQVSAFTRYGQLNFGADHDRDLIFQGVSADVDNSFVTNGVQADAAITANDRHTVRVGLLADYTQEYLDSHTSVFATNAAGDQASDVPFTINDDGGNYATEAGVYVQDEWKITKQLTLNYGLRFDTFQSNFDDESQLSPRVNLVYKPDEPTTFHVGYSRYFVPPPVQNVALASVNRFNGTTNAAAIDASDPPKVERSDYYDAGVSRQLFKPLTVGVDAFYKESRNLVDLGQFGDAVIESPYNYHRGHVYGAEFSSTYRQGGFSAFGNFGWVLTGAKDINSQQFEFDPDELAYIRTHDIKLDHESETTGSAGVAYTYKDDSVYADILYESGLRSGFANLDKLSPNYPVSVGYQHIWHVGDDGRNAIKFRFDCINVADQVYAIRDGGGLGVAAAQYGQRRSFLFGLAYDF